MSGSRRTEAFGLTAKQLQPRLDRIRSLVAKPLPQPFVDPEPALIEGGCLLIGNKHHAANVERLLSLGVTAVLNCASGGIASLPVDRMIESGIRYAFTNVRQDNLSYPILHHANGECSEHLQIAKALYGEVKQTGGKVMFFCVAGQNRSATLAVATLMLFGHSLDRILESCSQSRPFVLENTHFQRQLVELEFVLARFANKRLRLGPGVEVYTYATPPPRIQMARSREEEEAESNLVEIELLIPGLCTMEVKIPIECTIDTVKDRLIEHANEHLLAYAQPPSVIAESWLVLAMFGYDAKFDLPLEVAALELSVQLERIRTMFNLTVVNAGTEQRVQWNERCRFALVIFSVYERRQNGPPVHVPWKFVHEERSGAPATLLENTLMSTYLRGWDFVTGEAFASNEPIVFSFADDPGDRRAFMKVSRSANVAQQFQAPGEGDILGMGANAIVHRVDLKLTSAGTGNTNEMPMELSGEEGWDAAVKRQFGLSKMLASLQSKSEAGLAKRMRNANMLNSDGRVLYFYGLGVALAANAYNQNEYKFEATLLARYQEEFSTYTMKRFMADYITIPALVPDKERTAIKDMQASFSIISVKMLLVSLLNAFRDLTLMGVQAFDFNHLNNVLISRDHRTVQLIDIDGNSKGSIQFPSEYIQGLESTGKAPHKPSLDVDLNTVLPMVVHHLILGKGRGITFIDDKKSEIWHANEDDAKVMIKDVIRENFYSHVDGEECIKSNKHVEKVTEWFYAVLKKQSPWNNWTNDIYDAMRCIDHLPIS